MSSFTQSEDINNSNSGFLKNKFQTLEIHSLVDIKLVSDTKEEDTTNTRARKRRTISQAHQTVDKDRWRDQETVVDLRWSRSEEIQTVDSFKFLRIQ